MAYDQELDARVAHAVSAWDTKRKTMFGGTAYMLGGNMMAGVVGDQLVLRLSAQAGDAALREPFVRPFDMTPRPMAGWVMVGPGGYEGDRLESWLRVAKQFAESLPPK